MQEGNAGKLSQMPPWESSHDLPAAGGGEELLNRREGVVYEIPLGHGTLKCPFPLDWVSS